MSANESRISFLKENRHFEHNSKSLKTFTRVNIMLFGRIEKSYSFIYLFFFRLLDENEKIS